VTGAAWLIVIVEDSVDDRAEVRRLLLTGSDRRFTFIEAETGAAGLRMLRENGTARHRCVVLDYNLPDMTASAFLAAMSGKEGAPDWPVVVFTGGDSAEIGRKALRAGAHDYIGKGWMTQQGLVRAVENASERWAMARELREQTAAAQTSERHFAALAQATSDIVYRMSADWSVVLALDGPAGVAGSDAAHEGWAWLNQHIPVDEQARVREAIDLAIAHKSLFCLEHRVLRPDGAIGWAASRAVPICDANGSVLEWFGAAADITQRKAAELALARSQQQFRTLADSIPQLCFIAHPDGRTIWYNHRWFEYTGITFEESQGTGWHRVHDPRVLPEVVARWQEAILEKKPFEMIVPLKGAKGAYRQFLTRILPVMDEFGAVTRWFGTSTDVTAFKDIEAALSERERELQTLADNTPDILARFDRQSRYLFINASVERLTGLAPSLFLGKTNREIGMPVALCTMSDAALALAFDEGRTLSRELSFEGGDGIRHFHCTLVPERGRSGEVTSVLCVTRDRTEEKLAQDALRVADRRKDEFIATLAHELRNPLAPLRTGLQVLKLSRDAATAQRTQFIMERQLRQMVRLIDDLLDVSRITSGKVVLRPERIALQAMIQTAVDAVQPLLDASSQVLRLDVPSEPIWLQADPTRISQAVNNLLTNATKYSRNGSVIALGAQRADGVAVVTVADSGEGIPPNMLSDIFEMFTQVDRTLDRAQGGLGIGLALVRRLVEMHGGTVSAISAGLGKGSTFMLRLPISGDTAAVCVEPAASPVSVAFVCGLRVLIVDDNTDAAETLAALLSLRGHETRLAGSGAAAVAIAREFRPAVAFLDIGMPGMNGNETARRLRFEDRSGCMTLVALTGWGAESDRATAKDAGFDLHFTKPIDLGDLDRVLQKVASGERAGRAG